MMWLKRKKKQTAEWVKKDTLVIVGNGFDIWQGMDTRYSSFHQYYLEHRDEILKRLRIKKMQCIDSEGNKTDFSDVELIFGDPFYPQELGPDFWWNFEQSLSEIDAERLNLFFGKEKGDLREMEWRVRNAKKILTEAFCRWVQSIRTDEGDAGYRFGERCIFINFNYTDTLVKRFHINGADEFHIHGTAKDKSSIIFGHASHPQEPAHMLKQFGGRFEGLYYVDRALYEMDKHVQDNIRLLCMFLALRGVMHHEIKEVYVVGHSMSPADVEYFQFLMDATQAPGERPMVEAPEEEPEIDPLEGLDQEMQFLINTVGYGRTESQEEGADAVRRRFAREQAARDELFMKEFNRMIGGRNGGKMMLPQEIPVRTDDAIWHISCFSDDDRKRVESVMKQYGCKNYHLYSQIDTCLQRFKVDS